MKSPLQINSQGKLSEKQRYPQGTACGPWPANVFGDRVIVPEFELYSNPVIKISDVKQRRFNLIDRLILKFRITARGKLVDKGTV